MRLTNTLALVVFLGATAGCELVASVDRGKIPDGVGGQSAQGGGGAAQGGGGSNPGGGGNAPGGGGQGGLGGSQGGGGAGGMECVPVDDNLDCTEDVCENGQPVHNPTGSGTACNDNGGTLCDGAGVCVECLVGADCTSLVCDPVAHTCTAPTCSDLVTNGDETDVDCGGNTCPTCTTGQDCLVGGDCDSGVCTGNLCVSATCGDGVAQSGEACDDGNAVEGDGCDSNCTVSACGNGISAGAETCDDGNTADCDGCRGDCSAVETGCGDGFQCGAEGCDDGNAVDGDGCDSNCVPTGCGNGIVTGTEVCDDGNVVNGDGCDNNCTVTACGNGVVTGTEACDDGNAVDGDGCDNNCTVTACGNGVVTGTEVCDDGNAVNGDGCDTNCTASACGNGIVAGTEACDDGNAVNGDGCDNNCTVTACGNGVVTAGEACDDGNLVAGDCCSATCLVEAGCEVEPNNACGQATPATAFSGAPPTAAAFGAITPLADQDLFSFTLPTTSNVSIETFTGSTPGACAVGNDTLIQLRGTDCTTILGTDDDDGLNACSLVTPTTDAFARQLPAGTYFVRVEEFGNNAVIASYNVQIIRTSACQNAAVEPFEGCDDGNAGAGDGCSPTCTVEPGFLCAGSPSVCVPSCGDGVINGSDECDDANTTAGDGCSATCAIEVGYSCTGAPSVCTLMESACSDGLDNDGDGNADALDPDCQLPAYFTACGAGESLHVYRSAQVPKAIPDSNVTGVTTTVTVPTALTITRVALLYNITHTFDGDVDMFLTPPAAAQLDICTDNGAGGDNFVNTLLDTTCATNVTAGTAPFTGCFKPETAFTGLNGTNAQGVWSLKVADDAGGDTGTLTSWALVVCSNP